MSDEIKDDKDKGPPSIPPPEESVAYHLVDDALRIREITEEEVLTIIIIIIIHYHINTNIIIRLNY